MSEKDLQPLSSNALASLLRRQDVWRGHSQSFVSQEVVSSGSEALDAALLHRGWPKSCLIECMQANYAATWFVCAPAVRRMSEQGLVVLLNPPAMPHCIGLIQQDIDLDTVVIVRSSNTADFISSFVDLAKSQACSMLMAWQPKKNLNYAELRKCQLATLENNTLSFLYRHPAVLKQSSPATLRLHISVQARSLSLEFVKQKGKLPGDVVELALPDHWFTLPVYKDLDLYIDSPLYEQAQSTPWANRSKSKLISLNAYQSHRVRKA